MNFDPRLTPARPDLAAKHLEGRVQADRFVEGTLCEVADAVVPVRREARPDAPLETEALKGERVTVYETTDEGWCWGQLQTDGYVGWLPAHGLAAAGPEPTLKVHALRTLVFPAPNIKLPPINSLPFGARVSVARTEGSFVVGPDGGFIWARHLSPIDRHERDFVSVAERFIGTPYLWGGKTSFGIDCSGLVQIAARACGVDCPRDSDMQEQSLGEAVSVAGALSMPERGDTIFWPGHVAIVCDRRTLIHANAYHMAVVVEPIADAVARIKEAGSPVRTVRRVSARMQSGA